jgi:excisionase family DNA binding protein
MSIEKGRVGNKMAAWMSIAEAAKHTGLSTSIIKGLVRREQITFLKVPCKLRNSTRINLEDLDAFIVENSRENDRVQAKR